MNIKKIIRTIFNPTTIKIVALIVIVGFFFIHPVFAQGTATTNETLQNLQEILDKFISICSRGRVILAILAGKLMTNDFVYGAFMHMDIYLRKIRNIMKNFANFALVAIVIGAIVKSLVGKEAMDVKKIITNTLVAGILIQASRFLMGAVIDLSIVATAGISSFPISFLKNDAGLKSEMNDAISKFKSQRIVIDLDATKNKITTIPISGGTQSSADLRENVLPSYNSVSGPFIFLGMGVFHFQNFLGTESTSDVKTLTLGFALRFFLLFFFTIGLLLLFIANIMRVGLLRVFIIGAPFLILIQLFKLKTEGGGGILKIFSLSNLIAIVFKPVIFVIGISLMLIVIVSMQRGMLSSSSNRENDLNGVTLGVTGTTSTLAIEGITNVEVNQKDILGPGVIDEGKNFFSQLLMLLLTMFLMRRFVKLSLTLGGGPIEGVMTKLTGRAEELAKAAPVLPFKGTKASFGALQGFTKGQKAKIAEGFGMNVQGQFAKAEAEFGAYVNQKFLGIQPSWSQQDADDLDKIITQRGNFMGESVRLSGVRNEGLSINNSYRGPEFKKWLATNEGGNALKSTGVLGALREGTFEKTFEKEGAHMVENRKALHILMGGDAALSGGKKYDKQPISYSELINNVYHKSNEPTPTK